MKTLTSMSKWIDTKLSEHCDWWQQEMIRETVDEMVQVAGHSVKPSYSDYFEFARSMKSQTH